MGFVLNPPHGGLLGRDREMAALLDGLEAAREGEPTTFLVTGDAGIGKTRLLSELIVRADERVLWGGCLPIGERGVPYLPLIEMVRSLDDDTRATLPPALEALVSDKPDADEAAPSRAHLFQAVIGMLDGLATRAPLVVVFEDLHWADRSTLDLFGFLIGLLRDQRVLLVGTIRTDDLAADHPLRQEMAEWSRRPPVKRMDLGPLTPEDSLRLVAALRGEAGFTREQASRLIERADGNPFLIEELVAAGPDSSGTPERMRDLLLRRTHGLDPDLLRLLRIASVGGTNIDEHLLSQVAGLDIDETRAFLRSALEDHLLTIDERGCRFRHALVAEALHDDLLPAERAEFHAAYADAVTAGADQVPPAQLATHQVEAGRCAEALASWVRAGREAERQFAFAEALQANQSALRLWDEVPDAPDRAKASRVDLLRRTAEMAFLSGEFELACHTARQALSELDPAADPITTGLVYHRLARYLRNTAEADQALAVQQRAVELVPASPPSAERAEVLSGMALMLQYENRYTEALTLSKEAIDVAATVGAVQAEIQAKNTLGNAVCTLDDVDRGLAIIGEALEQARRSGDAHEQARSLWNLQVNRYLGTRLEEFVENSAATIASLRLTQPHWVIDHMIDTADMLFMLGRWDEADEILAAARRDDPARMEPVGVPELHIARGEFDDARALIKASAEPSSVPMVDIESRVREYVFTADIAAWEGENARAVQLIQTALEEFRGQEKPAVIRAGMAVGMRAAANLARHARTRGDTAGEGVAIAAGEAFYEHMREVMTRPGPADGWKREAACYWAQCQAELARLHRQLDPEAWWRANERWLELPMPYRAAYCRFRWAEDALAAGIDRPQIQPVVDELRDYLGALAAKPLLAEVTALARRARMADAGGLSDPYGLTDREREVLGQIADGATNRQIAEALFISEKTASVHVSNILRKLSASNRSEAAGKAIKEGLVGFADAESA